ncbi:MAG TPA: glucose-1-phosphate cytidylyltransferase [Baekduia sp.]|nr:glucose-1-phosphate cytidylyltransferase [Baekduia sp.]
MSAAGPKVVLLCGGQGTRMREETEFRPKPMVDVGGRPLLWHIMKHYAAHGFDDFVLCLGYRGAMIKEYFLNYRLLNSDFRIDLENGAIDHETDRPESWKVTLADTGDDAMTGARIKRVERYLGDSDLFLCTYGDGLSDVDLTELVAFHRAHGRLATVTGVLPPGRFGRLALDAEDAVHDFSEKPLEGEGRINGGFFVFSREFLELLSPDTSCVLEREPMERVARDGQLKMFRHDRFWQCADTLRDVELLRSLWSHDGAPWRTWDDRHAAAAPPGDRRGHDAA